MEITGKGLAAVIIPTLITACFTTIDNSIKWRAEMEHKQFDRQTKILDQIISTPDAGHRRALAEFYISTGVFTGGYLKELESTLAVAQAEVQNVADTGSAPEPVAEAALPEETDVTELASDETSGLPEPVPVEEYSGMPTFLPHLPAIEESAVQEPIVQPSSVQNIFLYDNLKN